jgi:hypothetical protein
MLLQVSVWFHNRRNKEKKETATGSTDVKEEVEDENSQVRTFPTVPGKTIPGT